MERARAEKKENWRGKQVIMDSASRLGEGGSLSALECRQRVWRKMRKNSRKKVKVVSAACGETPPPPEKQAGACYALDKGCASSSTTPLFCGPRRRPHSAASQGLRPLFFLVLLMREHLNASGSWSFSITRERERGSLQSTSCHSR